MTNENKEAQNNQDENIDWKEKFNDLINTCQNELKKTTQIGMKMLSASQSNARLHETYEALGLWLKENVENGTIQVTDERIKDLISEAKKLESDLENYESEVRNIKKG